MTPKVSRRDLLVASTALAFPFKLSTASTVNFRFVHITDLHIQPELGAFDGVKLCVSKILKLSPRPEFVILGGDAIMDGLTASYPRADLQFKLLAEALKPLEMPIHYVIGNHDVFGWDAKSTIDTHDAHFGKKLWEERLRQGQSYYSLTHKGWKFIFLDSIQPKGARAWGAAIDDVQLNWLKNEVSNTSGKIIVTTHVPLFTIFGQYYYGALMPGSDRLVIANTTDVFEAIGREKVKLVLQGHTHVCEECDYLGTRYLTAGSVCGEWWKGPRLGKHLEGFTVCDVTAEGVKTQYVPYGWHYRTS